MQIEEETILAIINCLIASADPYYPVSSLTRDVGLVCDIHNDDPKAVACLNEKMVGHLLHLQDLQCIMNVNGDYDWGYRPGAGLHNHTEVEGVITDEDWVFPHSYMGGCKESIIRLTAEGMQLKTVLESNEISPQNKKIALNAGGKMVLQALGALMRGVATGV